MHGASNRSHEKSSRDDDDRPSSFSHSLAFKLSPPEITGKNKWDDRSHEKYHRHPDRALLSRDDDEHHRRTSVPAFTPISIALPPAPPKPKAPEPFSHPHLSAFVALYDAQPNAACKRRVWDALTSAVVRLPSFII